MNHYTKLSIIVFRIIGTLLTLLGFMGLVYWVLNSLLLGSTSDPTSGSRGLSSIIFILVGIIIYYLGKPISRAIGKDLSD